MAVEPDDPLTVAFARMRLYDVSQLPVLEGERVCRHRRRERPAACRASRPQRIRVAGATGDDDQGCDTVDRRASIDDLLPIFESGLVAMVGDEGGFHGLITRIDVLNYLRKHRPGR